MILFIWFLLFAIASNDNSTDIRQKTDCQNAGSPGKCVAVEKCQAAFEQVKKQRYHEFARCGFEGRSEIICCPLSLTGGSKSKQACEQWAKLATVSSKYQIVNGKNATLGEFPHMVALGLFNPGERQYVFSCGGTLISERYVLTAAHCLLSSGRYEVKIARLGTIDVPEAVAEPDPAIDYDVVDVQIHKKYEWKTKLNDIALVKLDRTPSWSDTIRPACLYLKDDDPEKLYVTGWGVLGTTKSRSNILQKAALKPRPLSDCNSTYISTVNIHLERSQICAADVSMDACRGDSGGPMHVPVPDTAAFSVVGIISYGLECGSKYPGVYTRVYSYLDWIESIVWP